MARLVTSSNELIRVCPLALYHAAQVGISARVKDSASRSYLASLLTALEKTKKEIDPNDAIDNDVVAAAYVENFALKVFGMTDSEDRAGKATRGTAKKFLVAANLLELLQVFDKANVSDSVRHHHVHSSYRVPTDRLRSMIKFDMPSGKQRISQRLSVKDGNPLLGLLTKWNKIALHQISQSSRQPPTKPSPEEVGLHRHPLDSIPIHRAPENGARPPHRARLATSRLICQSAPRLVTTHGGRM